MIRFAWIAALVIASPAYAQSVDTTRILRGGAEQPAAPDATSKMTFGFPNDFFVMSSGKIMVHDAATRSVQIISADLQSATVIFDATSPAPLQYPTSGPTRLFHARGDTGYFLDVNQRAFRVISPEGVVVRRLKLGNLGDVAAFTGASRGSAVIDEQGRIITTQFLRRIITDSTIRPPLAESTLVVRIDPGEGKRDTIATLYNRYTEIRNIHSVPSDTPGRPPKMVGTRYTPLFDIGDAWVVTSDGRLAILRASDLHIDWRGRDGRWTRTPPAEFSRGRIRIASKAEALASGRRAIEAMPLQTTNGVGNVRSGIELTIVVDDSIPDFLPSFIPLTGQPDHSGGFWVQTGVRSVGRGMGPPTYAHIDSTGKVIGRLMTPFGWLPVGSTERWAFFAVSEGGRIHFVRTPIKR